MQDQLYDSGFYEAQSQGSLASARIVLSKLREVYAFASVLDVGCGVGTWLRAAEELGAVHILGLDGDYLPREALVIAPARFLPIDISLPFDLRRQFDLIICLEAAEHIAPQSAPDLVRSLAAHGDVILFSAALPFQGGTGHANENWLEYWGDLFDACDFHAIDCLRWQVWRDERVEWWYRQGVMLFERNGVDKIPRTPPREPRPASAVHPELLLRAVRRRPSRPLKTNLDQDIAYWRAVCAETPTIPPGYGAEFSPKPGAPHAFASYVELQAAPRWQLAPALADAMAPIRLAETPASALTRSAFAPDFIGLGVQRAASTWMYDLLRRHPGALLPPVKAMNFFNRRAFEPWAAYSGFGLSELAIEHLRDLLAYVEEIWPPWVKLLAHIASPANDQAWYEQIFQLPLPHRIKGEITPDYAMLPRSCFSDMLTLNPNVKIVIILRHPLLRALSQLGTIVDQAPAAAAFVDELSREDALRMRGRYELILALLQHVFAPEQVLVLFAEEIAANPHANAHQLAAFLGLDPALLPQDLIASKAYARATLLKLPAAALAELEDYYEETLRYMADAHPAQCETWRRRA